MRTFAEVYDRIPARGWLDEEEARLLWKCCEQTDGPILEVGCFHGRSTCLLAEFGRTLYCVDPFKDFDSDDPTGERTAVAFSKNVVELGFKDGLVTDGKIRDNEINLFRQKIEDWEPRMVDLAYLDGDHTFEGTLAQINKALMCGPLVIAVHDYTDQFVKLACDERLGRPKLVANRLAVWGIISE